MSHRARVDVPAPILNAVTGWIARAPPASGARPWQRAATVHAQVLLVLRWLRHRADLHSLIRDAAISDATAYRYLHEGLEVIAAYAPRPARDHHGRAHRRGGLPVPGRHADPHRQGRRPRRGRSRAVVLRQAPPARRQGAGAHRPNRLPLWVSAVRPGSTHDLTAAREMVLPTLYPHAARGLPVLPDKGYTGAGLGVHTPVKRPPAGSRSTLTPVPTTSC